MSLNKAIAGLAASVLVASVGGCANAKEVACPALSDTHLRYVQLFDGNPEEQVSLIADHSNSAQGYWKLGYVYDHGRSVTVRCVYADKQTRDIAISRRVDACRYQIDASGTTKLDCE
ncbi:lipoprotein [Caballeronia calidae]|uniref:Lipoprotein n=1 Tax=Caballeronia calidae TaxID=1777139 RepID=A0A158D4M2_9BURK|nr:STY0301 family protein [Caballeronia calidae]SAK89595.1 lipoprotein [Caballeronia calidae]